MKKLFSLLAAFAAMGSAVTFTSCDDDEETFDLPSIQVVDASLEQRAGESINVNASVVADAGISTVTVSVDGGTAVDVTGNLANEKGGVATFAFEVPTDASEGDTYEISFTVTDKQNRTATTATAATVTVSANPVQTIELNESAEGVGTSTWKSGNTYILNGKIYVNDGQILTIEAGAIVKGQTGQAENASALIVARGGKIIANGTESSPIIFTALADNLDRIDDLPIAQRGLWGGLILLGNAPINHANAQTTIEGIPTTASEYRSQYGVGTEAVTGKQWPSDPAHNGGELSYISLRHGGTNIGAGNEINGLTMGGVGSGTKIHHIEVFGNDDDGFEWFGGTVNTSYLASIYNQDDSYDWDFGWRGENQFWLAVQLLDETNASVFDASNRGFESDGAHSGNLNSSEFSKPRIFNLTLVGSNAANPTTPNTTDHNAFYFTENTGGLIHNSIIMGFGQGINITDVGGTNGNSRDRLAAGDLAFKHNIFTNVADNTFAGISGGLGVLQTYLEDAANGNEISDNPGISFTANQFSLLPAGGSLALTKSRSSLPSEANGFTYETADFIGAFGNSNWLKGWTAADEYGLLP